MKIKNKNRKFGTFQIAFLALLLGAFALGINAQTSRTNASPTPTPNGEVPEIISRADDFRTGNQIIIEPADPNLTPEQQIERIERLENSRKEVKTRENSSPAMKEEIYEQKQKRLLLNLDILSRAEQRADSLRQQLFSLIERENQIRTKLDQLAYDLRPEVIDRMISFAGSLRPEELREQRRKSLEAEKANLEYLLTEITGNKTGLQNNVQKADLLVDKLRSKVEKDIDDALADEDDL